MLFRSQVAAEPVHGADGTPPPANDIESPGPPPVFEDDILEASEVKRSPGWAIRKGDALNFEFLVWNAIRGQYGHLISWGFVEVLLCLGVFSYVDHQSFAFTLKQYKVILITGSLAVNGNLFFVLFISERIRNLRSFIEDITGDKLAVSNLYKTVYQNVVVCVVMLVCIRLGFLTFQKLGISAPPPIAKGIKMGLVVVFGTLGLVIGFVINVWRFFIRLGPLISNIDTSHPDRMGGLKPIADVNSRLLFIGALLIVIYTFGAGHSPYEYTAFKAYAYLWSGLAMFLWIIAAFLPTYTIHKVLKDAKLKQQNHLAAVKGLLLLSFERAMAERTPLDLGFFEGYATTVKSAVDVVRYFEQDLESMVTWLYRNGFRSVAQIFSIPAIISLLVNWSQIVKIFSKLANIHTAD